MYFARIFEDCNLPLEFIKYKNPLITLFLLLCNFSNGKYCFKNDSNLSEC